MLGSVPPALVLYVCVLQAQVSNLVYMTLFTTKTLQDPNTSEQNTQA